ncbi:MAG: LLM class flavin-dependent oxidoreductase [Myxococcota bacterium]|nr:LLM class flavin-dependent oxidoreductase [Myxococcota bacterium]
MNGDRRIHVFSTCPQSRDGERRGYLKRVADAARWSEQQGCEGMLVYSDNGLADPWLVSSAVLESTTRLCPLVAVQPAYEHPYAIAKRIATYAHLHERRICLNMIAGGFKNDLTALGDATPHDERYARLTEYTQIITRLLESDAPVTLEGRHYRVQGLTLAPAIAAELRPGVLMSGSSDAGLAAARATGAIPIRYPGRATDERPHAPGEGPHPGVRVGIIARGTPEEAWRIAHERFPPDRKGQIAHRLAMKTSDSQWHRQLSEMAATDAGRDDPYWLGPFENYRTFCPYLVGSHERVAGELARYVALGHRTFVLDIPPSEEDLAHAAHVFRRALEQSCDDPALAASARRARRGPSALVSRAPRASARTPS